MATEVRKLAKFTVTPAGDDAFSLHIEDDGGGVLELEATTDQLDILVDAIDEMLEKVDQEGDEEDEEEEEEEETRTRRR